MKKSNIPRKSSFLCLCLISSTVPCKFSNGFLRVGIFNDISVTTEYKTRAQTDKLQSEIDMLKEQLQLTKSQLEAAQHAHAIRLSKVGC